MKLTHVEWQQQLVDLAHLNGWHHLHVRRSIGEGRKWVTSTNVKGWPDLFLWHEGDKRTLAIEVKVHPDKPTDEQTAVLGSLSAAGVECHVLYPEQLDDAVRVLARRRVADGAAIADYGSSEPLRTGGIAP